MSYTQQTSPNLQFIKGHLFNLKICKARHINGRCNKSFSKQEKKEEWNE
jgi:hypothetical protein